MTNLAKPLNVARLSKEGVAIDLSLTEGVARDLAEAAEVLSVDALSGTLVVRPWRAHGYSVRGAFKATIQQTCSVTLEPVEEVLEEDVERYFLPQEDIDALEPPSLEEVEVYLDGPEPPEPLEGTEISLFDILREQILLSKSAFPRKEGALLPDTGAAGDSEEEGPAKPFAALKALKGGKEP